MFLCTCLRVVRGQLTCEHPYDFTGNSVDFVHPGNGHFGKLMVEVLSSVNGTCVGSQACGSSLPQCQALCSPELCLTAPLSASLGVLLWLLPLL